MIASENDGLDSDELLQLAVLDSSANRHDTAIVRLKKAIALNPNNAKAHYMLGAEHAEIGLVERAIEEMAMAVAIDSTLETAHFQLGLLLYTLGRIDEASSRWVLLDPLGEKHALVAFKNGLLHLAEGGFQEAEDVLILASESTIGTSVPLKADVEKVLTNLRRHRAQASEGASQSESETPRISHGLASRYGDMDA